MIVLLMKMINDNIIVALGISLIVSVLLLLVVYYYDYERGLPQNMLVISSHSTIELEQYEPLIPPVFFINTHNTHSSTVGNIIARAAQKYHMHSHKPTFNRGLPSSSIKDINHVFIHPTWMPWMMIPFNTYIAWTYQAVPNHLIVGSIRHPYIRHKTRYSTLLNADSLIVGHNLICREIGIQSLASLRSFIRDQRYLLSQWINRSIFSLRMTGLIIWIDYENLDKSLLIMKKWLGLSDFNEIYYVKTNSENIKDYEKPSEKWILQNSLDLELYSWAQELIEQLIAEFYPNGIAEELQEFQHTIQKPYQGDGLNILNMSEKEYQTYILRL